MIDDFTILSLSPSYHIRDFIWWQRILPSETVYEPLHVVFALYKVWWKSSPIPTNTTGSRWHPPQWLTSRGPNYQCGILLISAGKTEGHFAGKTPWESHQRGLVLAWQCPGSPGTCNSVETGLPRLPVSCPPCSPDLAPWDLHLFPGLKKTIESSPFFVRCGGHCCRKPGWTDNLLNFFFEWFAKVRATG